MGLFFESKEEKSARLAKEVADKKKSANLEARNASNAEKLKIEAEEKASKQKEKEANAEAIAQEKRLNAATKEAEVHRYKVEQERLNTEQARINAELEKKRIEDETFKALPPEVQLQILKDKRDKEEIARIEKERIEELQRLENEAIQLERAKKIEEQNAYENEIKRIMKEGFALNFSSTSGEGLGAKEVKGTLFFDSKLVIQYQSEGTFSKITKGIGLGNVHTNQIILEKDDIIDLNFTSKMFGQLNKFNIKTSRNDISKIAEYSKNEVKLSIKKSDITLAEELIKKFKEQK